MIINMDIVNRTWWMVHGIWISQKYHRQHDIVASFAVKVHIREYSYIHQGMHRKNVKTAFGCAITSAIFVSIWNRMSYSQLEQRIRKKRQQTKHRKLKHWRHYLLEHWHYMILHRTDDTNWKVQQLYGSEVPVAGIATIIHISTILP